MIYFLFGSDSYRIREKIEEIKNFYQQKYPSLLGFDSYDFEEKNVFDGFKNFFETVSMFAPQKLAVAFNIFNSPDFKKIAEFLNRSPIQKSKDLNLIIAQSDFDKDKIKKLSAEKTELFKFLQKSAKVQEFYPFQNFSSALPWLKKQLQKYSIEIELSALKFLFENFKNDSYRLINELLKAALFAQGTKITLKDIEKVGSFDVAPDFFAIFNEFFAGHKKRVIFWIEAAIKAGIDEGQIFNYFVKQIRNAIYLLNRQNENIELPPFVINQIKRNLARWPKAKETLIKIYDQLAKIDWLIKKGVMDYHSALEILITHLK